MPRGVRFGVPWDEQDARSRLIRRLHGVRDRLLHPDLAIAAAAASELCCILYTVLSPPTGLHVYYSLDDEVAEYKTLTGGSENLGWLITCCHSCTCTWSHWCSCERTANSLEYRLIELLRRCTSSQGQLTLTLGQSHKRKRDVVQRVDASSDSFCKSALNDTLRAMSIFARVPTEMRHSSLNIERKGPIDQAQLAQKLFGLLRSDRWLHSDETWANVAVCLMKTFQAVSPIISVWTDHPRSVATLLGWAPRWTTKVERVRPLGNPLGGGEANRVRFCAVDEEEDRPLSAADELMVTRLLHVSRGWPRLGWLHHEAADNALGLLWILHSAGPWEVRNLICRDTQLLCRILRQGRRRALRFGLGDPVQMDEEWYQFDNESDADYQQRIAAIPSMLPSQIGQSLHTAPWSEDEDGSGEEDEQEAGGLAWADHPPLLVPGDPSSPSEECSICLESLTELEQVHRNGRPKSLHCRCVGARTLYHEVCLRQHLVRSNTCPLCRATPATTPSAFWIPYHPSPTKHTSRS